MRRVHWRTVQTLMMALTLLLAASALFAANYVWEGEAAGAFTGTAFAPKKYTRDPAGNVSGKKVLAIKKVPQGEKVPAGTASYRIKLPADGTYYLWGRVLWSTGCGNSIWITAPGVNKYVLGGDGTYDSMHWLRLNDSGKPKALKLKKGVNTITLTAKESGVMLDQFLLTTDIGTIPGGTYAPTPNLLAP